METRVFTKQELHHFIFSEQFENLDYIPISKHRAISQINNPRASDDDIILIARFDKNLLIGYLGVLPDFVYRENECHKVGWLTCFWISKQYRSGTTAADLLLSAFSAWDQNILITNMVPGLEKLYMKSGLFQPVREKTGIRCYMRFNMAEILPPKDELYKSIAPVLRVFDCIMNAIADKRFWLINTGSKSEAKVEYVNSLDQESKNFINSMMTTNWNRRSTSEIAWILGNPWILEGIEEDHNSSRYYFSSFSKRFFYQMIRIKDAQDRIIAIMLLCIRDKSMTVPYLYAVDDCYGILKRILIKKMVYLKISMITIFQEALARAFNHNGVTFLFRKKIIRSYMVSKKLDFINNLDFQDGDGDCAFY